MSKAGSRILEGAREALAVAKGESPAASIMVNGHRYVPAALVAKASADAIEQCARYHDDLAAQHAAAHENVVSDHHEMMERQHRRDAAAIRRIKPSEAEGREATNDSP